MWLDTLSMARLLLGNHLSASLESLAKHFGLGAKNIPLRPFQGQALGGDSAGGAAADSGGMLQ